MGRGSTWRIWDFHLHTPYSILNNQFGDPNSDDTWDRYIDAIEAKVAELNIAAIAITDYFTIEGYKRVLQYQLQGRLKGLLIFPNIEFRVDPLIEKRRLNVHVLFSPDVPETHIEEHFLHDLNFVLDSDPFEGSHKRKLKLANLEDFGATLQQQHAPFRDRTSLEIGCMNAKVKLEEIKERLDTDGRFSGRHLLVLAEENLSLLNWNGQDHGTRKQLLQMSHAVFSANSGTRDFCLGRHHSSITAFVAEFKSLKPCIWGCDSHGLDQRFLEPDQDRYCWIKGDVSWEGLKQILYEPEDRVRIQPTSPEPPKSFFTLDSIKIAQTQANKALCVDNFETSLNHNLVVIIGGRGSGKTALLDLIAANFREGEKLSDLDASFYSRLYARRSRSADAVPVPVSLRFRSGVEFGKLVGRDDVVFEQSNVLYLTQNHMDVYTANPTKLYEHIIDLAFSTKPDERRSFDALSEQVESQLHGLETLNLEIEQLRQQVEGRQNEEEGELAQKNGALVDFQSRLSEQEAQLRDRSDKTTTLTDSLDKARMLRDQAFSLQQMLSRLLERVGLFNNEYQASVKEINGLLSALAVEVSSLVLLPGELPQFSTITQSLTLDVELLDNARPGIDEQILTLEEELGQLKGVDHNIAQLRLTINSIKADIEAINVRLDDLKQKKKRIAELEEGRKRAHVELMAKTVEQRLYLQRIIDNFETNQDKLLNGLAFRACVDTTLRIGFLSKVVELLDGRAHSNDSVAKDLDRIIETVDKLLNLPADLAACDSSALMTAVEDLYTWGRNARLKRNVSESTFFNTLCSPFFHIGLQVQFNERPLEALSMGERAVVLLKILLGLDDKPLLIDQPEEHLDNRYIYDELTPAFRCAKEKRQIIIATHNANLVVNTDAEQVIVAEHTNGTLSYRVGTLEDLTLRESITTILEGGNQAFKKREAKYGIASNK